MGESLRRINVNKIQQFFKPQLRQIIWYYSVVSAGWCQDPYWEIYKSFLGALSSGMVTFHDQCACI